MKAYTRRKMRKIMGFPIGVQITGYEAPYNGRSPIHNQTFVLKR